MSTDTDNGTRLFSDFGSSRAQALICHALAVMVYHSYACCLTVNKPFPNETLSVYLLQVTQTTRHFLVFQNIYIWVIRYILFSICIGVSFLEHNNFDL